jgi:hypothetical protein
MLRNTALFASSEIHSGQSVSRKDIEVDSLFLGADQPRSNWLDFTIHDWIVKLFDALINVLAYVFMICYVINSFTMCESVLPATCSKSLSCHVRKL